MQVYINEGLKEKKYRFTKSFSLQNGKDSKDECYQIVIGNELLQLQNPGKRKKQ